MDCSTQDLPVHHHSRSLPKLMSIESMMPSNHLILCSPLLLPSIFPSIRVFSNESVFTSGGQSIGASASASVLPMNIQFSSVAQLCLTLCDPMNHSTPGLPVHHQLLEFTQTHVHNFSKIFIILTVLRLSCGSWDLHSSTRASD